MSCDLKNAADHGLMGLDLGDGIVDLIGEVCGSVPVSESEAERAVHSLETAAYREALKDYSGSITMPVMPEGMNRRERRRWEREHGMYGSDPMAKRTASMKVRRN